MRTNPPTGAGKSETEAVMPLVSETLPSNEAVITSSRCRAKSESMTIPLTRDLAAAFARPKPSGHVFVLLRKIFFDPAKLRLDLLVDLAELCGHAAAAGGNLRIG